MSIIENLKLDEDWLQDEKLQTLFDILEREGGEARVAGGAVRNALMGKPASDVDLCTTVLPEQVLSRLKEAGYKGVPTGIEHGTITAVIEGNAFEVTTLRKDIETDGRHAVVEFGTDWQEDANRRDLTINGLYCDRVGNVYDYVNGYPDISEKQVRFIGDAAIRIKEDSLRILRFFRFFAWYGEGRPDAAGLKACAQGKDLISGLSVERVWAELKNTFSAPDPGRAILWMRTTGILGVVLPESQKWGTDAIPGLLRLEVQEGWKPDPLFRLMGMVRPDKKTVEGLSDRLSMSNAEKERLTDWADSIAPSPDTSLSDLERQIYHANKQGMLDAMRLEAVHLLGRDDEARALALLKLAKHCEEWVKPKFPLQGHDLAELGMSSGPEMGKQLKALEAKWVESGFSLSKQTLLETIKV